MKLVGGFLIGAFVLSGCSFSASAGGASIEPESIEAEILSDLTESVGVAPKEINCDGIEDIDVEEGNTFTCTGTAPAGDTFDVNVTLTDDEGGFTAVVPG